MTQRKKSSVKAISFTQREIRALPSPAQGRAEYADKRQQGLRLRVSATGAKSFSAVLKQKNGRTVRVTIGKFPGVTVETARSEAIRLAGEIAAGVDIAARKEAERSLLTLSELFDMYERDRIANGKRRMSDVRQTFERWIGRIPDEPPKKHGRKRTKPHGSVDWASRRIDAITQRDVATLLERLKERGLATTANRLQEIISAMYGFAKRRHLYDGDSPAAGIEPAPEVERRRFLLSDEFPRFFEALRTIDQPWQDYFTLLLFIGYRRRAIAAMRWADLDLKDGMWHVPVAVSKNREPLVLPLVGESLSLLKGRKKTVQSEYVFPGGGKDGHITEPKKQWAKLVAAAGLGDLHMHDLRRSLGSSLAMSGYSLPQIGRVLGHRDPKSTQIYAKLQLDNVAAASASAQSRMLSFGKVNAKGRRR